MNKNFTLLVILFFISVASTQINAQVERVIYQTFNLNDSTENVFLKLHDNFEVIGWHHDHDIMVESTVQLKGGSMDLLKAFINEGRYLFQPKSELVTTTLQLSMDKPQREFIKFKGNTCEEIVTHRIYLPDGYLKVADNNFARKPETILVNKE